MAPGETALGGGACVAPAHLGPVRSRLNEVALTIAADARMCVCVRASVSECPSAACAGVRVCPCDWQAQTVCDVLINHIDSLLLR